MLWRQVFDTPSYQKFFGPPQEKTWDYVLPATQESVIERAFSKSYITILPEDEKTRLQDDLRKIISLGNKVWMDEQEGIFEYPYTTWVVVAQKRYLVLEK